MTNEAFKQACKHEGIESGSYCEAAAIRAFHRYNATHLEETIKEAIFATLVHLQGSPPADTQLAEWGNAVNEIYREICWTDEDLAKAKLEAKKMRDYFQSPS